MRSRIISAAILCSALYCAYVFLPVPSVVRAEDRIGGQASPPPPSDQKPPEPKSVDLGKFVTVATTPVGLIIAGAIIISFFEQKRAGSSVQVRALIGELRTDKISPERRRVLIPQVEHFKCRLRTIRAGATLVARQPFCCSSPPILPPRWD